MSDPTVTAYILTFDDPDALRTCLAKVLEQDPGPDEVVIVDNASHPPAEAPDLAAGHFGAPVRILRLDENVGPAGGHEAGLRDFLATGADLAWVFDDDVTPEPGCLAAMLAASEASHWKGTVFARQVGPDGRPDNHPRWAGVLIPRAAVAAAGGPMPELFWWTEDTEYLAHRLPRAGFPMGMATAARVSHAASRRTARTPDWKIYYETRNTVYYRVRIQHGRRAWKIVRYLGRAIVRIARQTPPRATSLRMVAAGLIDGVRGRLGKTIDPPRAE